MECHFICQPNTGKALHKGVTDEQKMDSLFMCVYLVFVLIFVGYTLSCISCLTLI